MSMTEKMKIVSHLVNLEYACACKKHPGFSKGSIERAYIVLGEEVGEVANAILEGDNRNLLVEIAQVAAVCLRFLELCVEE